MVHLNRSDIWTEIRQNRVWKPWAKRFIILGVFGLSALLAMVGSQQQLRMLLILIAGAIGLIILLQQPCLGLFGVLLGGFFLGYSGPGGVNLAVLAVAAVSGLWVIDMIVRQRKIALAETRVNLPIILFILTSIISFGVGQFPWYPLSRNAPIDAQMGGMAIFALSAFAFLTVGNLIRDLRWLQAFTWLFVIIGALYVIARLVPPIAEVLIRHVYQNGAIRGSIFWVWLLVIPFSQALLNHHLHKFWRAALAMLIVGVLYVSIIQAYDWKSGFLPPLVGAAIIIALLLRKRVVYFVPVLVVIAVYTGSQAIATDEYSWITRQDAWKIVIQLSSISPIFGIGFGNYYWYTPLVPILGWHVSFNSHSQYVDIFSQTGLAGLICFFWIFWEIWRLGWQLKDRVPEGFMKAYIYGALGGVAGTLVAGGLVDWVLPFVYNIGMNGFRSSVLSWLFLGGIVAINEIVKKENKPRTVL